MMRTILIVEDERSLCDAISALFEIEGYRVRCAHDGLEALRMLDEELPDVVLSDVSMPRLDGLGLLARLREAEVAVPVVLMSARTSVEAPGVPLVPKPFDAAALLETVARVLDTARVAVVEGQ